MNYQNAVTSISLKLKHSNFLKLAEIIIVFLAAIGIIKLLPPLVGDNPIMKQAIVWFANVIMLIIIWAGIKLRRQGLEVLGLKIRKISRAQLFKILLQSLLVFVFAVSAFVLGTVLIVPLAGIPESSDLSGYEYLRNNFWMLLLTLVGVYLVSSIGEEIIYRAFLINRISSLFGDGKYVTSIAVILSAIIFGLVHFEWGVTGMVQTGLMGIALGISYIKLKQNLAPLILAHVYMDTILILQMYHTSS